MVEGGEARRGRGMRNCHQDVIYDIRINFKKGKEHAFRR